MSTRVYLTKNMHNPQGEDPRVHEETAQSCDCHRATLRSAACLSHDDVRLVRRITVLLDLLGHQVPVEVVCDDGVSAPPVSTTGIRRFCCGAWIAWSIGMAGGVQNS